MHPKYDALWLPAQFGKTGKVMDMIREEHPDDLNVLICSNNRMLVAQTSSRMRSDLFRTAFDTESSDEESTVSSASDEDADDKIEGDVYSWMSGKKANVSFGELANSIKEEEVSMIICCAHAVRFGYLLKLIADLEKSKLFFKKINVWIDEADASVKLWSKFEFTSFTKVNKICLVSATYSSVIKKFGSIRVLPLSPGETARDTYMPLLECVRVHFDGTLDDLLVARPEISLPGSRFFVPGVIARVSHDEIVDYLVSRNFAVMVLNGHRKEIVCPDGTKIPIALEMNEKDPDEISKILPALYKKYDLARWPFAVTGHLCLGRGITFQSSEFMFDFGFIPNVGDADTSYQLVARMLGNIKGSSDFKAPTIFMSEKTEENCLRQEKTARMVANMVYEKGWISVGREEIDFLHRRDPAHYDLAKSGVNTNVGFSPIFENPGLARNWSKTSLTHQAVVMNLCGADGKSGQSHFHYREPRAVVGFAELRVLKDLSWAQGRGASGRPRIMPVVREGVIAWVVVYANHFAKA
jgi:hypothetical protein